MSFQIKHIAGEARFDCLPVIKLCCDESIDINERVYAQAQLGRNDEELFVRILSFEPNPSKKAKLSLKLCFNGNCLEAYATAGEAYSLLINGEEAKNALTVHLISGEDLQGEYWGAVFTLSLDKALKALGLDKTSLPAALTGNLKREHPAVSAASVSGEAEFVLN